MARADSLSLLREREAPREGKLTKSVLCLLVLFAATAAGCITSGGQGGWPIEAYSYTCDHGMLPMEPACLTMAAYDGRFKYSGQFSACKDSMLNFTSALDAYYRCSDGRLKTIFDKLLNDVPDTYNCYLGFFRNTSTGDPSLNCPPIEVPRFYQSYEAHGLEINLGVPRCIAKSDNYNFAPKMAYQLDDCKRQVETFVGKSTLYGHSDAAPAQKQYDAYLANLRRVIDRKVDEAVRKFNCLAEGRRYCY